MKWSSAVTFLLLFMCCTVEAESGLYASFSASRFSVLTDWEYGATPGFYYDHWRMHRIHAGVDLRAQLLGSGTEKLQGGLIGPRIVLDRFVAGLKPYGEGLIGGSHVTLVERESDIENNSFEFEFVLGVDRNVSPRVDWRLAEISWGKVTSAGPPFALTTVSTGLVFRFP